jgi:kumamolisin
MGWSAVRFRAGAAGVRWFRLLVATACALVLASGAPPVHAPAEQNLIGGPLGRLLARSADLGPARNKHAQLTVALRDPARPEALFAWARDRGLSVRWRAGDDWASVGGPTPNVASAFGVAVHNYRSRDGQVFYASRQQPAVPAPLAGEVTALGRILSYHRIHTARPPTPPRDVPQLGLTPAQLLRTYNAGPLATTGKGQTIVFYEIDGYDQFDLDTYSATFGLPKFTPTVVGGQPGPPGGETPMDLEVAHAIAPDARLVVVNALHGFGWDNNDEDFSTEFQDIGKTYESTDRQFPGAIWSMSLISECDKIHNLTDVRPAQAALATAETHGTSAFTCAGDTGGLECKGDGRDFSGPNDPPTPDDVGVNTLASMPEMTDVGGTSLSTDQNGAWLEEPTWGDSPLSQGTGGGVSSIFLRPGWQSGVSSPKDSTYRLTPDVAADANPYTGVYIVENGEWEGGGGTSQSTPIWAGLTALMNQYLLEHGGKALGQLNPLLYQVAAKGARPAFHDVTVGGNAVYNAGPGFDLVTGLGTPNTDNLVHDLLDIQQGPR